MFIVRADLGAPLPERYSGKPDRVQQKQYRKIAVEEIVPLIAHRVAHPEKNE
jgi:hypothetical protein